MTEPAPLDEFDCADCGHHVYRLACAAPANDDGPPRCAECAWIAHHVPPGQQAAMRARLRP